MTDAMKQLVEAARNGPRRTESLYDWAKRYNPPGASGLLKAMNEVRVAIAAVEQEIRAAAKKRQGEGS